MSYNKINVAFFFFFCRTVISGPTGEAELSRSDCFYVPHCNFPPEQQKYFWGPFADKHANSKTLRFQVHVCPILSTPALEEAMLVYVLNQDPSHVSTHPDLSSLKIFCFSLCNKRLDFG